MRLVWSLYHQHPCTYAILNLLLLPRNRLREHNSIRYVRPLTIVIACDSPWFTIIYIARFFNGTFNLPTQSVLPHGTQATVVRKSNSAAWVCYQENNNSYARSSSGTGTYAKMEVRGSVGVLGNKYQTSSGFFDENISFDPKGGLIVDLTQATGAQGIVCIKY